MRALAARPRGRGSSVWHGVVGASCGHRGRTRALFSAMFGLENIWMAIALKHADTHGHNVASRGVCAGGSEERLAADGDELDVEFEGGAGRDVGRRAALAVCEIRRAGQRGLLALAHLEHALVPSLDDVTGADLELERLLG